MEWRLIIIFCGKCYACVLVPPKFIGIVAPPAPSRFLIIPNCCSQRTILSCNATSKRLACSGVIMIRLFTCALGKKLINFSAHAKSPKSRCLFLNLSSYLNLICKFKSKNTLLSFSYKQPYLWRDELGVSNFVFFSKYSSKKFLLQI